MTYTAHSGDGHRAGDETKAFVHAHIKGSRPTIAHTLLQRNLWFGDIQSMYNLKFSFLDFVENDLRSFFSKYRCRAQKVGVLHYQWLYHWKIQVEEWKVFPVGLINNINCSYVRFRLDASDYLNLNNCSSCCVAISLITMMENDSLTFVANDLTVYSGWSLTYHISEETTHCRFPPDQTG